MAGEQESREVVSRLVDTEINTKAQGGGKENLMPGQVDENQNVLRFLKDTLKNNETIRDGHLSLVGASNTASPRYQTSNIFFVTKYNTIKEYNSMKFETGDGAYIKILQRPTDVNEAEKPETKITKPFKPRPPRVATTKPNLNNPLPVSKMDYTKNATKFEQIMADFGWKCKEIKSLQEILQYTDIYIHNNVRRINVGIKNSEDALSLGKLLSKCSRIEWMKLHNMSDDKLGTTLESCGNEMAPVDRLEIWDSLHVFGRQLSFFTQNIKNLRVVDSNFTKHEFIKFVEALQLRQTFNEVKLQSRRIGLGHVKALKRLMEHVDGEMILNQGIHSGVKKKLPDKHKYQVMFALDFTKISKSSDSLKWTKLNPFYV